MSVNSSLSCCKVEYMHIVPFGRGPCLKIDFPTEQTFFRFILDFKITKLDLEFQINSNRFSRDRSFGHKTN